MGFSGALKGGGLFTGDGTLGQFTFSRIAPGSKKPGEWAYIVLAFTADGKQKEDTQHLFLGGAKQYEFEEGGTEAYSVDEKTQERKAKNRIGKNTGAGLFFRTLYAAAKAADVDLDTVLPDSDAGEALDLSALVGTRVSLAQQVNEKLTEDKGKRKGSDGNEYDRTETIVETFYELGDGASDSKPAAKGAKGSKAGKEDNTIRDAADEFVQSQIAAAHDKKNKTGEVATSTFKMALLRSGDVDKSIKDAVGKLLKDEDYFKDAAERGVFSYDSDEETVSDA